jgi:hypothetical protein
MTGRVLHIASLLAKYIHHEHGKPSILVVGMNASGGAHI